MSQLSFQWISGRVFWSAVNNAIGYKVTLTGEGVNKTETLDSTATMYQVSETVSGQYTVSVIAKGNNVNFRDSEARSLDISYTYFTPLLPQLTMSEVFIDASTKVVRWAKVSDAIGYDLRITSGNTTVATADKDSPLIFQSPSNPDEMNYIFTQTPTENSTYSIRITALADTENHRDSNERSVTIAFNFLTAPEVSTNYKSGDTIEYTWAKIANAAGYKVTFTAQGKSLDEILVAPYDSNGVTLTETETNVVLTIRGLGNGIINGTVTAVPAPPTQSPILMDSAPADMPEKTIIPAATPLAAPANLRIGDEYLIWDAVTNAAGYFVKIGENGTPINTGTTTQHLVGNLAPPETYSFYVMAIGDEITGLDSAWASIEHTVSFYESGIGTDDDPFIITTAAELTSFANYINSGNTYEGVYFELGGNIDLDGVAWTPIGSGEEVYFNGTFNGAGHIISNFSITGTSITKNPGTTYAGLFGYNMGTIKNLGVTSFTINVPPSGSASIITVGAFVVGGLTGYNGGTVSACFTDSATINVTAGATGNPGNTWHCYAGGLVGQNVGDISNSYSLATVIAQAYYRAISGGLVGVNQSSATITNSYARAANRVEARNMDGGTNRQAIAGGLVGTGGGLVENCFAGASIVAFNGGSSTAGNIASLGGLFGIDTNFESINNFRLLPQGFTRTLGTSTTYIATNSAGTTVAPAHHEGEEFYTDTLGWSTGIWRIIDRTTPYPTLAIFA